MAYQDWLGYLEKLVESENLDQMVHPALQALEVMIAEDVPAAYLVLKAKVEMLVYLDTKVHLVQLENPVSQVLKAFLENLVQVVRMDLK